MPLEPVPLELVPLELVPLELVLLEPGEVWLEPVVLQVQLFSHRCLLAETPSSTRLDPSTVHLSLFVC